MTVAPALAPYAGRWPDAIADVALGAIDAGEVAAEDLRTVVVAPTRDWLTLGIWLGSTWEDHPYVSGAPAGLVPLDAWLDEVDAFAFGADAPAPAAWSPRRVTPPVRFADRAKDAAWRDRLIALEQALAAAAQRAAMGRLAPLGLEQPVGIFVALDTEREARIAAFCHPQGAPLLPLRERRPELDTDSYPWATLVDEGLVVFYPEGEGDALADKGAASIQTYRFEDMRRAAHDGDDVLSVWFGAEAFEIAFSPGMTHEEHGGPGHHDVAEALLAHFRRRPELWPSDEDRLALPCDGAALAQLLGQVAQDHQRSDVIEALVNRHGVDAVVPLLGAAGLDGALWQRVHGDLARAFLAQGRAAEALAHLDALAPGQGVHEGSARLPWLRAEALWALGRHEEAVAVDAPEERALPFRALSLAALGRAGEAVELLSAKAAARDAGALTVRAVLLARAGEGERARAALRTAFVEGTPARRLLALAAGEPALAGVLAEREAWRAVREASAAQAAEAPLLGAPLPGAAWDAEVVPARLLGAPLPARLPGAPVQDEAPARAEVAQEAAPPRLHCAVRVGERVWAGDGRGAVVELSRDGAGRRELCRPCAEGAIRGLCVVPAGVVASDGRRLALLGPDGAVLATAQALSRGDGPLAASGDMVALGNDEAIDLYRARGGLARVGALALPGRCSVTALAFAGPTTLLALQDGDVWLADVGDPARPRWRGRLRIPDPSGLAAAGDRAVVFDDRQAWVVSLEDADRPAVVGRFAVPHTPRVACEGGALSVVGRGLHLRVSVAERRATESEWLVGADGYPMDTPLLLSTEGDARWAVTDDGLVRLAPLAWLRPPEAIAAEVAEVAARVGPWMKETLQGWLDDPHLGTAPLGVVRILWCPDEVRLSAGGASSLPGAPGAEGASAALAIGPATAPPSREATRTAEKEQLLRLEGVDGELVTAEQARAQRRLAFDLRALLARSPRAARHALVLCYDARRDAYQVVDVVATAGTARPARAEVATPRRLTVRERLTAHDWSMSVDTLVARARRVPAFRAEVLASMARESLPAAARIAEALVADDPGAVRAAWLAAAERDPAYAVHGLVALASHPEVRRTLEALCASDDPAVALPAREAMGRLEEPAALAMVRRLLAGVADGGAEAPLVTLRALSDAALPTVRAELVAAHAALREQGSAEAKELLPLLVFAGVEALPTGTLEAAEEDRRIEGDGLLGDEDAGPAVTALRHHVTRRIGQTLSAGSEGALWPADVPPESSPAGWHRLFEIAWPAWERAGLVDELHRRLPARLAAEDGKADAQLALSLLVEDLLRADPRGEALGAALREARLPPRKLRQVAKLARLHRVQFGWTLVKEERLAEARRIADAALADDPDDGQILFFDARLAWLERGDPEEALRRIPAALARVRDGAGRGRLYNLHGAALDALGRHAESIAWFERALAADPGFRASALSNIAEAHWKLGQRDEALRFARKAARQGATTEIVQAILDAARDA